MKRVKLKRDMNHKNRLTLANSGGRFCYEVTNLLLSAKTQKGINIPPEAL